MTTSKPSVQRLSTADLQRDLDTVLERVGRNEALVMIERDGRALAAIVQADELARLRRLEAEWQRPFEVVDHICEAFADRSDDEIERDVVAVIGRTRAAARIAMADGDKA